MIELCDLKRQYKEIRSEAMLVFDEIASKGSFIGGRYVAEFEEAFSNILGSKNGVGCANGTSALMIALKAVGIKPGDEVIVPSHTFVATVEAIAHVGALPIFVDINEKDYTMNVEHIEKKITKKTRAILPVHIYGSICEMDTITSIAKIHKLYVIEDSAQAHFAKFKGKYAGTFGDAGAFSFYPGKNLGAFGDGGFMTFRRTQHAEIAKRLTNHGSLTKFDHNLVGYTDRLDSIQAGILSIKLNYIERWSERRREVAEMYNDFFGEQFKVIEPSKNCEPVYHLYVIEVSNRKIVMEKLMDQNIQTGVHYPKPVHMMKQFGTFIDPHCPVTEKIRDRIISLPMHPHITKEEVEYVAEQFLKVAQP